MNGKAKGTDIVFVPPVVATITHLNSQFNPSSYYCGARHNPHRGGPTGTDNEKKVTCAVCRTKLGIK